MAETIQHKELDWDDIHHPFDKSYANQAARKAASGLESKHLYHLAYQVSDGSGWRITQVTPSVEMVPFSPPEPVVGDIGKSLVVQSDGDSYLKLGWQTVAGASGTLDNAYDNGTGERTITVDDGDVSWDLTGAYSFVIDLAGAIGTADGFFVENGTDYFRILRIGTGLIEASIKVEDYAVTTDVDVQYTVGNDFAVEADNNIEMTAHGTTSKIEVTDNGSLTIQTIGAGSTGHINIYSINNVDINANDDFLVDASGISLDASGASNFTVDGGGDLTLACTGGDPPGDIIINAVVVDVNGYSVDIDASSGNVTIDAASAVSIDAATASNFTVNGATADLTLGARGATVTLNESGETTLDTTAQSLVGAINEINAAAGNPTLDDAYNNDTGERTIIVDDGDVSWDLTGAYSFVADLAGVTGTADGYFVVDGTDNFNLIHKGANLLDLDADLQTAEIDASVGISLDAVAASNFTVSGATADLTLGARGATVTLNESGETTLDTTAQSLVGAINEVNAASAAPTLDDAYNNDTGERTIIVDAGDVSWNLTGAYSFVADLAGATGTADGYFVVDGTDNFNLIHKGANLLDLDADLQTAEIDASVGISLDAVAASNFTVSGASADLTLGARGTTVTLNESGETTLDTTAQSLVGAINEVNASVGAHASTHEDGGGDEISVAGLSGELADDQPPKAHASAHQSGGGDAIKLDDLATPDDNTDLDSSLTKHGLLLKLGGGTTNYLRADGSWAAPPGGGAHASTHEDGGGDEISVAGLSGELADDQPPKTHASAHQSGGGDAIKLDDLATPDDNTDLDATTGVHGLLPKLGGGTTNFLRADGSWAAPAGGGGDLDLDITPASDHTGSGITADWQVDVNGTGIGAILYVAADGNLEEADADDPDKIFGLCLAMESGTGVKSVLKKGVFRDDTWDWTVGEPIYLSTTAGAMTQTVPVTNPAFQEPIGFAISADVIWFDPPVNVRRKYYIESEGISTTTEASYQDKVSLTIPAGTYNLGWTSSLRPTTDSWVNVYVQFYDATNTTEIQVGKDNGGTEGWVAQGGFRENVVLTGSTTLKIRYYANAAYGAGIKYARIRAIKIG